MNAINAPTAPPTIPVAVKNSKHIPARDRIGQTFGRLTVISLKCRNARLQWTAICRCICGKECEARLGNLVSGTTRSCGCYLMEVSIMNGKKCLRHGHKQGRKRTATYSTWQSMISRCTSKTGSSWARYGGRGITVCDRWRRFDNFLKDMGERPPGLSLDRRDNNAGYCKENCRWATREEQQRNRRCNRMLTVNGETMCAADWADRIGMDKSILLHRIYKGFSDFDAVTRPVVPRKRASIL